MLKKLTAWPLAIGCALIFASAPGLAAAPAASPVTGAAGSAQLRVSAPWIRATVPQAKATGAFMELQAVRDARLVGVESPVAGLAEVHSMAMDKHVMRMQAVDSLALPAGKPVALASGGYHVMLMQLKRQLKEGDTVPLTLIVEYDGPAKPGKAQRERIELSVPVKALTYAPPR